jgi:acetyltransferase-like isoleucine patch superfamily enzyme
MNIYRILLKATRKIQRIVDEGLGQIYTAFLFKANRVKCKKRLKSRGFPIIYVSDTGRLEIGCDFAMNSGMHFNQIGKNQRCMLIVDGDLTIGDNVGISSAAIVCQLSIEIGSNVRIGGDTVIYDTDFHSLDYRERTAIPEIKKNVGRMPVKVGDNVFIGAGCTILKGVEIGCNSIIGAGSVVVKHVPDNQIWGGNPAKFISHIGEPRIAHHSRKITGT